MKDPYKASYGVEDPEFAISQLAQTTMRSEIGKKTCPKIIGSVHTAEKWKNRAKFVYEWFHVYYKQMIKSTFLKYFLHPAL